MKTRPAIFKSLLSTLCMILVTPYLYAQEPDSSATELSVPPIGHIEYAEGRPSWMQNFGEGVSSKNRMVVVAGPFLTSEESEAELMNLKREASITLVRALIQETLGENNIKPLFTDSQIDQMFVEKSYKGSVTIGGSQQFESGAELMVSDAATEYLMALVQRTLIEKRIRTLALAFTFLTSLLAISVVISKRRITEQLS